MISAVLYYCFRLCVECVPWLCVISAVLYLLFQIVCRVCSLALCDFSCVVFTVSDCVSSVFPGSV